MASVDSKSAVSPMLILGKSRLINKICNAPLFSSGSLSAVQCICWRLRVDTVDRYCQDGAEVREEDTEEIRNIEKSLVQPRSDLRREIKN